MKSLILLAVLAVVAVGTPAATAAPAAKKYHFELTKVLAKENVKPDVAKIAQARIEAQLKKAFETNPQLVANLDGAPDPKSSAEAYRQFLARKGVAGAAPAAGARIARTASKIRLFMARIMP